MIKHVVALSLLAVTSTATADKLAKADKPAEKPAFTVSNLKWPPRKAEDPKRKPFVMDLSATVKLDRKIDDPKLAYLHVFASCHVGTALSGDYAAPETQTPLTEMKVGKTQELKVVVFTTFGFEVVPDKCKIEIRQGEDKGFARGTTVSNFCWTNAKKTVKSC
jgi:hypothetical protein